MEDVIAEQFEYRRKLSVYWYNKSSDLRGAAGAVWASIKNPNQSELAESLGFGGGFSFQVACPPVYLMLAGMSLELLIKSILVAKSIEPPMKHDLVLLGQKADIVFSQKQIALLSILSEYIIWGGRYPVPTQEKNFEKLRDMTWEHLWDPVPTTSRLKIRRPNDRLDWDSFNELWNVVFESHRFDFITYVESESPPPFI